MNNITTHLGQKSEYKSTYDNSLLVGEERSKNRQDFYTSNAPIQELPFIGWDVWNAYECSFILENGLPVSGILKIVYSQDSYMLVESKSLKLYLNSFNMQKIEGTIKTAIGYFENLVSTDLTNLLKTKVCCVFFQAGVSAYFNVNTPSERAMKEFQTNMDTFIQLESIKNMLNIDFEKFQADPYLLQFDSNNTDQVRSSLLKSNCKVTGQPDWGDIFIYYKGDIGLTRESLLKYIVSFRDERNFHERICEQVYMAIHDKIHPRELFVMCNYTRRGGIDINPVRASSNKVLNTFAKQIVNPTAFWIKTDKQ